MGPSDSKVHSNQIYLQAKKFDQNFLALEPKLIDPRLCMGFLETKIPKEEKGIGVLERIIDQKKKWVLLVSAQPIIPDRRDHNDEWLLETTQIPFSLELDTLFVFSSDVDDSPPEAKYYMKDVLDVSQEKTKNADEQKFIIDVAGKKISFVTPDKLDLQKWMKAIECSVATCRELAKSRFRRFKNISLILKTFDEHGLDKLEDKIRDDLGKIRIQTVGDDEVITESNIDSLLQLQRANAEEFLSVEVVNGCLCQPTIRVDIIKIYSEKVHENIMTAIRTYYFRFNEKLENLDLFGMIKFFKSYSEDLSKLGARLLDQRIPVAINTLCRVVAKRIVRSNLPMINAVLKQECDMKVELDSQGKLYTLSPSDVFKILNETFNILTRCSVPELASAIIVACDELLEYYQRALLLISQKVDFNVDKLISLCNNTVAYMKLVNEFLENAKIVTKLAEKVEMMIQPGENIKQFGEVGIVALDKLMTKVMKAHEELFKKSFLELNIDIITTHVLESLNDPCRKIHSTYRTKILKQCMDRLILMYSKCFIQSLENKLFNKDNRQTAIDKLKQDRQLIYESFKESFKNEILNTALRVIDAKIKFLVCKQDDIIGCAENLKDIYGESFKISLLKLLFDFKDDVSTERKILLLKECERLLSEMDQKLKLRKGDTDSNSIAHTSIQSKLNLTMNEEDDQYESKKQNQVVSAKRRVAYVEAVKIEMEGALSIKKSEFLNAITTLLNFDWTEIYCMVRSRVILAYMNKGATTSLFEIQIKDIISIDELKGSELKITTKGQIYIFKAKNELEREVWVKCFRLNQALEDSEKEIHIKENVYKSTDNILEDKEGEVELNFHMSIVLPELFPHPSKKPENSGSSTLKQNRVGQEEDGNRRKSIDMNDILPEKYTNTKKYLFEPEPQRTPSCWSFFSLSRGTNSRRASEIKPSREGSLLK